MPESIEKPFQEKSPLEIVPHLLAADTQNPQHENEKGLLGILGDIVTGDTEK